MSVQAPAGYQSNVITTELIQKYLDENKQLILAILDNQNLGKLNECAQYQARLQQNLMYLAAIADAQPQVPAQPVSYTPQPTQAPPPQPAATYSQPPPAQPYGAPTAAPMEAQQYAPQPAEGAAAAQMDPAASAAAAAPPAYAADGSSAYDPAAVAAGAQVAAVPAEYTASGPQVVEQQAGEGAMAVEGGAGA